jgi:hypothetical protein
MPSLTGHFGHFPNLRTPATNNEINDLNAIKWRLPCTIHGG